MGFSILRDMVTALRGGVNEVGETIVDSQAMRIADQEIRDAKDAIAKARSALTKLKSREISLKKEISIIDDDIGSYTASAREAITAGNEALALKVAEKIGDLREKKDGIASQHTVLSREVDKILQVIQSREQKIKENEIELEKARSIEELNKINSAISSSMPGTSNTSKRVERALNRVKERNKDFANNEEAGQWLADAETGGDLDKELAAAGIGSKKSSASSILDEFR
ncbi:MAG: phage shock protein A [Flavobacteriales bacterium]|jgi:phage shock protein A